VDDGELSTFISVKLGIAKTTALQGERDPTFNFRSCVVIRYSIILDYHSSHHHPALSPLRFVYLTAMTRNAKLFFKTALYVPFLACVVNAQSSGSKEFYDACAKGDLESVKEYIENDPCT